MSRLLTRVAAVALAGVFVVALVIASRTGSLSPSQRAHRLESELRCPVCQALSVADSHSSTSLEIAADVHRRVLAGQSDQQIKSYYVTRYGEWILLSPSGGAGMVAWLVPIVVVGGAVAAVGLALRRWSRRETRTPTAEDLALVRQRRRPVAAPPAGSST